MEALEEVVGTGSKDHTHIVKGKRTKRQRPQSPIPFAIATHSSSGDGDGGYTNAATATATNNINTTSSPATSAELVESATEEEEDMANCLILLAQGHSRDLSSKQNNQDHEHIGFKFKSKRFLAAASTGNGKAGMYVYQCKTCSRTFPSFQALGGHRASHKKPKLAAMAVEKRPVTLFSDDEEKQPKNHISSSSLSLQLSNRPWYGNPKSSTKIHECAICGAEFMSGQALGGHMRRHRTATGGANTTLSLSPIGCDSSEDQEAKKPRIVLSLDLDLNLPAPEESNFTFASKQQHEQQQQQQQQSSLVLPAVPTLVDCHY